MKSRHVDYFLTLSLRSNFFFVVSFASFLKETFEIFPFVFDSMFTTCFDVKRVVKTVKEGKGSFLVT